MLVRIESAFLICIQKKYKKYALYRAHVIRSLSLYKPVDNECQCAITGYVAGGTKAILQSKNGYQQGGARFIESQNGNNNAQ